MKVNWKIVFGLVLFIGLGVYLFKLPKAAVNNKSLATSDSSGSASKESAADADIHLPDADKLAEISSIRKELSTSSNASKPALFSKMAQSFLKANQFDSAGYYYEKAAEIKADPKLNFKAGSAYFDGLPFASNASKVDFLVGKVRQQLGKIPEGTPESAEAQAKIALTFVNSEAPMKGILKLKELEEKYPENTFILYQLGLLSIQSGQYEKALPRLKKLVQLDPTHINGLFYLAQAYKQTGNRTEALKMVEKGLELAQEDDTKASFQELKSELKN